MRVREVARALVFDVSELLLITVAAVIKLGALFDLRELVRPGGCHAEDTIPSALLAVLAVLLQPCGRGIFGMRSGWRSSGGTLHQGEAQAAGSGPKGPEGRRFILSRHGCVRL